MTTAMPGDRIAIANDVAELRRMTEWLWSNAAAARIPRELVRALDVCANEIVTNIISHAYDDTARHEITLELSRIASGARLVVRDDGKPFAMPEAPRHQVPGSLDEAAIGGLGIHLVRRLATRCEYRREGGHNVLAVEVQSDARACNA